LGSAWESRRNDDGGDILDELMDRTKVLTVALSLVAGSMDVISFLCLGGLSTAHITGNLVILAAHLATGEAAQVAPMLSVPVFMAALFIARLAAGVLQKVGIDSLKPLLLVQFLLLAGCLAICLALGSGFDPNGATATVVGMIAVCALGVQNALVQVSLHGVPTTAVVTTYVARFTTDIGTILLGAGRAEEDAAGEEPTKSGRRLSALSSVAPLALSVNLATA
jgi:uncharacterized membrane protein YoaK (UPF0700 family)